MTVRKCLITDFETDYILVRLVCEGVACESAWRTPQPYQAAVLPSKEKMELLPDSSYRFSSHQTGTVLFTLETANAGRGLQVFR